MIFWLFVILCVIGILMILFDEYCEGYEFLSKIDDYISLFGFVATAISVIAIVVMLIIIIPTHITSASTAEQLRERYRALEFKISNESYRDEFGLLNKEVIDEIQQWNEEISFNKSAQEDFWIGVFVPNIYDEFETIDYERF